MNPVDPVEKLLTMSDKPVVSDLVTARYLEAQNAPPRPDTRLEYKTYDDDVKSADELYDPMDFKKVGGLIRDNVVHSIQTRFPVVGDKYTLTVENVAYEKPKNTSLKAEKYALQHGQSVSDRLRGDWVLYDNTTGQEVQRKSATLLNVPRMTERGTFIRNGAEQGLKHMFRLRPGIYARIKGDGHPSVHINPAQLTGRQMSLDMDPETGIMIAKRGTRTYGVLPLLLASGVPEDAIRASWGDELYEMNYAKYGKMINPENKVFQEYQALYKDELEPIQLDEETTASTMGAPYKSLTPDALLQASNKVLKLSRSMSADDEDDRDSLAYQRVMGPADYIPERIVRDGGGLVRKMFQRVIRDGNLDSIESGAFQPHVDSVFLEDKHASYIDGASPFEAMDLNSMVSRIGEGGIGDIKAAPAETRGVNDSYLGFIDPVRCYSEDTEILTKDGWVSVKDMTTDMEYACLIDDLLVYKKADAVNAYDFEGEMISYESAAVAFCVTPNHRMYTCSLLDEEDAYHIVLACNVYEEKDLQFFVSGKHFHNTQIHLAPQNFSKVQYTGKVYCPTVPGGLVYVRKDGKAGFWCGNSPESLKVGLDVYMAYGTKKDSKGRLYANFLDKAGNSGYRPMDTIARSIVATPEFYDPMADPMEFIPAINKGKQIDYVRRKDVDFFLASSNNMMSIGAGTIPNIGGIRSNRTLMGCLHPNTELIVKIGASAPMHITAAEALKLYNDGVAVEIPVMTEDKTSYYWKEVRQILVMHSRPIFDIATEDGNVARVTDNHKWLVKDTDGNLDLVESSKLSLSKHSIPKATVAGEIKWVMLTGIGMTLIPDTDYTVDIDVDDNVYMLANGLFTHNSKYPLQALSLEKREAPLVQRKMTVDGVDTTTERVIAKQLGAKFAPIDGKVISVSADEIVIRDREGKKHTIELYNNYPANQKGFLTNTPIVQEGQRIHANDILAKSNYTTDTGEAALGVNLRTAFLPAKGSANFEDAIVISESAAKKLASEQMHKFRGDLSADTEYGKKKFLQLFGAGEYTKEQLDKIEDDGMPLPGTVFQKGDPVFLGTQIRDLSTAGLSRRASVPYVKLWEHEEPGTVIDVTQGKKHMTIYTKSYTPMRPGDKMCFDDQTEILTDSGWKFFKDLLLEDKVLTIDYHTGESRFVDYSDAYSYDVVDEKMYTLKTKRLDICTTKSHRHLVSCMNNSSYLTLKTSDEIFGKRIYHLVGLDLDSRYNFAGSKDDNPKEKWTKYTGKVYCITVPGTHTMYVRRNGKAVWSGNSGRYGAKGVVSCYDSSTYVFTDKGFKPFPELTVEDKVAYLDPVTNIARFTNPSEVQHAPYKGVMYGFDGKYLDWLVTPTHDMWVRRDYECIRHPEDQLFHRENVQNVHDGRWQHRVSATFESNQHCPTRFVLPEVEHRANAKNTVREFDIIDFAAFLGIWLAEGHLDYSEDFQQRHFVIITQKCDTNIPATVERCDKIESLLNRMGIIWSRQGIKYLISHKALCVFLSQFGHAKAKFIPEYVFTEWSREAQEVFVAWLYMGDGDKTGVNDLRYNTCSPALRDGIQRLCTLLGKQAKCVTSREPGKDRSGRNHDYLFRVSISDREFANSGNGKGKVKAKGYYLQDYNGTIHCCTVPTGIIYVMRNGKPMWCGNSIVPDSQMPQDPQGRPMEVLMTPLGLPSRLNTAMLGELQLSKIAEARGQSYTIPDFITDNTIDGFVSKELKKYGLSEKEDLYDPVSGKTIPQVSTGLLYNYKLKHMAELKERGRGTGVYTSEDVPMKGAGAARRFGMMEASAVYAGGGMDVLRDAKLIRGQRNDDFWHDYKEGLTPQMPTTPLVHKKFMAYLRASGASIQRNGDLVHMYAATDADMKDLTGNRKVTSASTFDSKNMHPIDGGLFDPKIFGADGDQWGYVDLPEPVLNPLMFKPVASIMGWTDTELKEYLQGSRHTKGDFGTIPLMEQLKSVDLKSELKKAKDVLKAEGRTTIAQRDLARKRIRAIEPMLREGKHPTDFFFTRMPILPPKYRTVTTIGDETNVAADANFLYKRMMDAADDLKAAKDNLPEEYQVDARESLYNAVNAVVGTMPTDDPKLEAKGVGGLLKWAFGKGSPKHSSAHRKIFGANLDMGGLGTITPDGDLSMDEVGIPEESAWKMFEPFVLRDLRQSGFSSLNAMREVLERTPEARRSLERQMANRPILVNRAPTLWRYGIQGMYPKIVKDNSIHLNPNVCKVYNADFDGDTIRGSVQIAFSAEFFKGALEESQNCDILSSVTQTTEDNMLHKEAKVDMVNVRCAICDIPRIEESAKQLSETVTEWDVPEGVFTEAIDKATGKKVVAPVTKLSLHKDVDMYDVHLATYGAYKHIITVSKDDTLLTYENGEIVITDASTAKGKLVPRAKATDAGMSTEHCAKYIDLGVQVPLTFDVGVFLGMMIGDGWVDSNNIPRLAAEDVNIQNKFIEITTAGNTYLPIRKTSELYEYHTERFGNSTAHRITVYLESGCSKALKDKIGSGAYNKRIPLESLAASKAHRLGVLVGLISTDGNISYSDKPAKGKRASQKSILFHTTSQDLRDNIIDLCFGLGVRATSTEYMGTNSKAPCYGVNLSVRDMAKLYKSEPRFRLIAERDEENMKLIADTVEREAEESYDSYDIVPYPAHLGVVIAKAAGDVIVGTERNRYKNKGFFSRDLAKLVAERMKSYDFSTYNENNSGPVAQRPGLTPEQAKEKADAWIQLVKDESICWEVVTDVTHLGTMDGWDVTVPGPLTFTLGGGTFVQDSMSTHVPVSNEAVRAIKENMLPSKNLISPQSGKAHFIPRDGANTGLYLASRIGKGTPVKFRTEEEAEEAYRKGLIKIDTPIEIG